MKMLLEKKACLLYLAIGMIVLLTGIVDNAFGSGPTCPPCSEFVFDGHVWRCGGCVIDCGACYTCASGSCKETYDGQTQQCCDCRSICNYNDCKSCVSDGSGTCVSNCGPNSNCCGNKHCCPIGTGCCGSEGLCCNEAECMQCDLAGSNTCVSVCEPNQRCCNSFCYDPNTQVCCGGIVRDKGNCMACVNGEWVSTCEPNQCQDCNTTTNTCQVCGGDPNKSCCYGSCCNKQECEECNDITHSCKICGDRAGEHCCTGCCIATTPDCREAGSHDSSILPIDYGDNYNSTTCAPFGYMQPYMATYNVDFTYESCQWTCEISNVVVKTTIEVSCPTCVPGMVSVSSASQVPCSDANIAKFDLDDTDLSDDHGAPRTTYWCYDATYAHEFFHRGDWILRYLPELDTAISACESMTVTIDCGHPETTTCSGAYGTKACEIEEFFNRAWRNAWESMNPQSTSLNEAEQRAYEVSYEYEHSISAALPGGCSP